MNLSSLLDTMCEGKSIPRRRLLDGKNGYVYYLKIVYDTVVYYKIGVTSRMPVQRIKALAPIEGVTIKIVGERYFDTLLEAYAIEQQLHKLYKSHRYSYDRKSCKKFISNGMTELYIKDVLALDKGKYLEQKSIAYSRCR